MLACLRDVVLDGRPALLVTHGGSMRLMRCFVEERGIDTFHEDAMRNGVLDEIVHDGLAERIERFLLGNA